MIKEEIPFGEIDLAHPDIDETEQSYCVETDFNEAESEEPETIDFETTPANEAENPEPAKSRRRKADKTAVEQSEKTSDSKSGRASFFDIDFKTLDRNLSDEQQREWNEIYASYRAQSVLTGTVLGLDTVSLMVRDDSSGELVKKYINCLVVINYRVKILIPESEVWHSEKSKQSESVLRNMVGADIDYIIREVDRESECALASRRLALDRRQRTFKNKLRYKEGDKLDCRVVAVGSTMMLIETHGFERMLSQSDISYGSKLDLREEYKPGEVYKAVFKGFDDKGMVLSIKEVNPHPFDGADSRHPPHSRRLSRITGKYAGGVFCALEKDLTCLCLYSPEQRDEDFDPGDTVIIVIDRFDYGRKRVYGKIISKR